VRRFEGCGDRARGVEGFGQRQRATLQALRKTIGDAHGLLSTDSGLGFGLEAALANLKDATNALRLLMASLEQTPDMLLRGKKPQEDR